MHICIAYQCVYVYVYVKWIIGEENRLPSIIIIRNHESFFFSFNQSKIVVHFCMVNRIWLYVKKRACDTFGSSTFNTFINSFFLWICGFSNDIFSIKEKNRKYFKHLAAFNRFAYHNKNLNKNILIQWRKKLTVKIWIVHRLCVDGSLRVKLKIRTKKKEKRKTESQKKWKKKK